MGAVQGELQDLLLLLTTFAGVLLLLLMKDKQMPDCKQALGRSLRLHAQTLGVHHKIQRNKI